MSKTITGTITTGITLAVNPTIIDGTIQSYNDAIYSKCRMGERSATHRFFEPAIYRSLILRSPIQFVRFRKSRGH